MVHAVFGADGKAIEWEIAESSDPSVNSAAVGLKALNIRFPRRRELSPEPGFF